LAAENNPVSQGGIPDLLQEDHLSKDVVEDEEDTEVIYEIYDPLEPLNRVFFEFNDKLYFWVLKPVKTGYSYVIPAELRECIGNFFNNLAAPIRLINNLLQGKFEDAGVVFMRFVINSTFGVYGLADVALQEYNLEPRLADLDQTLGAYGLGEGVYICWPVLGPSNIRHSIGLAGDAFASPAIYINMTTEQSALYYSVNRINFLSLSPDVYEDMKKYSLDPYVATRQSFYDFRRNFVKKARNEETDF
jgi:phospholipid-binding lipoprotein MlaA